MGPPRVATEKKCVGTEDPQEEYVVKESDMPEFPAKWVDHLHNGNRLLLVG